MLRLIPSLRAGRSGYILRVSPKNGAIKNLHMPYISETALRSLKFNRKTLPPQHIVVNTVSDYPVTKKEYVHYHSVSYHLHIVKSGICSPNILPGKSNRWIIGKVPFDTLASPPEILSG